MTRRSLHVDGVKSHGRSRITNGRLPAGIDGRSEPARRFRDLMRAYAQDYEITSEVDRTLVQQATLLTMEREDLQAAKLRGERVDLETLNNLTGQLRRVFADLKRKPRGNDPVEEST